MRFAFCGGSQSVEYGEATLVDALKKVEQMGADLGGTEILQPLKHIYGQPPIPSQPRQVTLALFGGCAPPPAPPDAKGADGK